MIVNDHEDLQVAITMRRFNEWCHTSQADGTALLETSGKSPSFGRSSDQTVSWEKPPCSALASVVLLSPLVRRLRGQPSTRRWRWRSDAPWMLPAKAAIRSLPLYLVVYRFCASA
jgi:hypothetical protein